MADPVKLESTVPGPTTDVITQLSSETQSGSVDAKLLQSEIQNSLQAFLASLASNEVISENDPIAQLAAAEPAIQSYITSIQQAIVEAKEGTPQGLLLAQNLNLGIITPTQFAAGIAAITLTPLSLQSAVAADLPNATQNLILNLASAAKLKTLKKLISIAHGSTAKETARLDGEKDPQNKIEAKARLDSLFVDDKLGFLNGSNDAAALPITVTSTKQSNALLESDRKDVKLSFLQNLFEIAKAIAIQNAKASASSLLSLSPQPRIMTGARAVLKLNGKVAALCNNVQFEVSTDWTEVRGVDELIANDLAPTSYSVKGSMSIYRVPNKSPVGEFLQQDMFRGMIWPYTTIEIRDKRTDELIMLVKRAAITSRSESFTKNQLTSTNLSFIGIGFRDEQMPEGMPDKLEGEDSSGTAGTLLGAFKAISNLLP